MKEQIEEDLQHANTPDLKAVDRCFTKLAHSYPWICRYRLLDNELYLYVPEGKELSKEDTHTEKAIKTLTQVRHMPDMDFLISYLDAYPLGGVLPEDLSSPLMVSGKLRGSFNGILIPDERSIGPWWLGELRMIQKNRVPWHQKKQSAFWRGGFTKELRRDLCLISLNYPEHLDARIVPPADRQNLLEEEGLLGSRCNWIDLLQYRYLPIVDGVMCAWPAYQGRLFSQSLTLKPDSEEIQWFYRTLKPNHHYVPVAKDLSDLVEKIEWARSSDEECQKIAENAYQFAKENLMFGDIMNYLLAVLTRYAEEQKADPRQMKEEIKRSANWVYRS